jgi:hypothetical protein
MGCDIHGVVERRASQGLLGEKWVAVRTLHGFTADRPNEYGSRYAFNIARSRNYERFAALAGVRGDGPTPRGLPEDASETSRLLFKTEGDHTPSWLPLSEAAAIFLATERSELTDFERKYAVSTYFSVDTGDNEDWRDYRLVFWFDS